MKPLLSLFSKTSLTQEDQMPRVDAEFRLSTSKKVAAAFIGTSAAFYLLGKAHSHQFTSTATLMDVALEDARRGLSEAQVHAHVCEENLKQPARYQVKSSVHLDLIVKGALGCQESRR